MSRFLGPWLVAALDGEPRERLEAFRRGFRPRSDGLDAQTIFFWATLACLCVVGYWLSQQVRVLLGRRWQRDPWALFYALCKTHRLDRRQTRLLTDLAVNRQLKYPALVFVDRRLFDQDGLPANLVRHGAQLAEIRERLFALPGDDGHAAAEIAGDPSN